MIEQKFWKPSVTSQFTICPAPLHLDIFRGCTINCKYCFARDFVTFSRRNSEHKDFGYLVANKPESFRKWIERVNNSDYDYTKAHEVAWKERIPLKIGATSDPFPVIEGELKITYEFLKILNEYDYPVEIQTKNPEILASYAEDFIGANWAIAVTLISTDEDFLKVCEPGAISAKRRLNAVKKLTDMGFNVMFKVQPAIYPKIIKDLPELIKAFSEAGAWAFNIEGLKVRISMPISEQSLIQEIGDYIGYDLRAFYKNEKIESGIKGGSDYELSPAKKEEFILLANELAKQYELKFFNADNHIIKIGDGHECCGTQKLRNYKLLGCDARSRMFDTSKGSTELEKCYVNFMRSTKNKEKTIKEVCDMNNPLK